MKLEDLQVNAVIGGILPEGSVTIVGVKWFGSEALELTYKLPSGAVANELLYRDREANIQIVAQGSPWSFDGDGALFRLASEALRIRLAHLFDQFLAVHTSVVDPLPHQITAVYESMLPRQPLRFVLADDPGAGKTIMAGLLMKELIIRGDVERCLVVCPGSLAEQWQLEMYNRFQLTFEILTNERLLAAPSGNWFKESNLVIARLDKLARDEDVQQLLKDPECRWDLIVCDEAHKMSATFYGNEIKYTKRYRLGQMLSGLTRHFLLMTATPHNGKETDFQLFMALVDYDRFEGQFREGIHSVDVSGLMRRMVKENLLTFGGTPLFPERVAHTVPYKLSSMEAGLYKEVTAYVREEFNRADALENNKRKGTVGFALTVLQRRLASSPEAIYRSLQRRRERLEARLQEIEEMGHGKRAFAAFDTSRPAYDDEYYEDLEEAPEDEVSTAENEILDEATAARSAAELKAEIGTLGRLEDFAREVRRSGADEKWINLAGLLQKLLLEGKYSARRSRKLVIFTEHVDTLNYLFRRISTLLGDDHSIVVIHGGKTRKDRLEVQESFRHDPKVHVLLATDAAGEGINLQCAHLMVNYDLPWNPNRLEQRFGRIHRIGQTEVCHLWNLVADETREGDVYFKLLDKLEQARKTLGGQVFDVLGHLHFGGSSLRKLLVEAIRYGEQPEIRDRLTTAVDNALDRDKLRDLLEAHALAQHSMDTRRVYEVAEDMARAEARRMQPHYVESFFQEAFRRLNGSIHERESRRFEITHVPATVRARARILGSRAPVVERYERITFEKALMTQPGHPAAAFVCPGHPLLDVVTDLTLERHRSLLKQGAVLADDRDDGKSPRIMFYLEHAIQDGTTTRLGGRRVISKRTLYLEIDANGVQRQLRYAPYLDYRPLAPHDPEPQDILARPECAWIHRDLEKQAMEYAVKEVVPEHYDEIRKEKLLLTAKTRAAVKDRLTKQIAYWDHRAEQLKEREQAGKSGARLNSGEARKRADVLQERLGRRIKELQMEEQLSPLPPVILGGVLVAPKGLVDAMSGKEDKDATRRVTDTQLSAARARDAVMAVERRLGFEPTDRELDKLGYDIESRIPGSGKLRFIEVKGRVSGAATITVTRNEILTSLNTPEDYILGIVEFLECDDYRVRYLRKPFQREPDFGVTSVNYNFADLLARSEEPL